MIEGLDIIIEKINNIKCEHNIKLIIDTREQKILKHIRDLPFVTVSQLDIGDIHFRINGKTIYIMERKTLEDLSHSIKDGRFREQKIRLQKCLSQDINIIYLIEGHLEQKYYAKQKRCKVFGLPLNTIIGTQTNIILRDRMQVHKTTCLEESILFLLDFYKKLKTHCDKYMSKTIKVKSDYVDNIHISKKKNMNKDNCIIIQLAQIPGVSVHMAKAIVLECKSLKNLCNAYSNFEDEKEKEKFLETITYSVKGGKSRKIGKVISKRIYEYLS